MYLRLTGNFPHGRSLRGRNQKYTSTQIPSNAWRKDGMLQTKNCKSPNLKQNYLLSVENHRVRVEYFPGLTSLEIFQKLQKICKIKTLNLSILKDELSSCQCSMTSTGRREDIQKSVFRIPNKSRITRRDSRENNGRSWAQNMKKNGTERAPTILKDNGSQCYRNAGTFQRNVTPREF